MTQTLHEKLETFTTKYINSIVHGMPQRASEVAKAVQVLSIDDIINTIHQFDEE